MAFHRLANHFQIAKHRVLNHRLGKERFSAACGKRGNAVRGIANVR
jgi:hypothetical protein